MSASKSIQTQPASTLQMYRYGTGEDQWSPNTTDVHGDATPLQWTSIPQHPASVSSNGTSAPYEGSKFSNAGVTTPIDLDNPHSFTQINGSQNSMLPEYNMITTPPMTHGINSSSVLLTPSSQNTMPNGRNMWMTPVSSTSQFITRAPAWNVTKTGGVKKPKRIRTAFTSQQMMELEQEYARTRYLDRSRRIELAKILHLNERTIKIWFQNRRMKEKKDRAESLEDSEETTESSPEHGNIPVPMLVPQDFPTPVADAIFKQEGVYLEPYSETAAPLPIQTLDLPHSMNSYTFTQEQHQAFEYRQLQYENEAPVYVQEMQEMSPQFKEESPQSPDQGSIIMPVAGDQNDISWIRNIYPDEEY